MHGRETVILIHRKMSLLQPIMIGLRMDKAMMYITHKREDDTYQQLSDHIYGVAQKAAGYAAAFGAGAHAERMGLLHDIGKYSAAAQARQLDPEHTLPVDHSTAGMQTALQMNDIHTAFCVAGHHGGLPNLGSRASLDDGTLMARAKKRLTGTLDCSVRKQEIRVNPGTVCPRWLDEAQRSRGRYSPPHGRSGLK